MASITLTQSTPRRELYSLGLYRILAAATMAALVFSPWGVGGQDVGGWLIELVSTLYLVVSIVVLGLSRREQWLIPLVVGGTIVDIGVATLATHALPQVAGGIAMLLLFNLAAAAMLLPRRMGLGLALLASCTLASEFVWVSVVGDIQRRSTTELLMFVGSYLALAWLGYQIGQRARLIQKEAGSAKARVANLVEINEMIIRRLRTGVLVVDEDNHISLANEAASALIGPEGRGNLGQIAPTLLERLEHWRDTGETDDSPLALFEDRPQIIPRFASILADDELTLVFLDDASVSARRAETMTLVTMGRFSASLAHEVRNPLAAISYATQLLQELYSEQPGPDRGEGRLIEIIRNQTQRTNNIVESVLSLARREQALPVQMDLVEFVKSYIDEYQLSQTSENDHLDGDLPRAKAWVMADPRHLHQITTSLVHNAMKYGRSDDGHARVTLRVVVSEHGAFLDILDRGAGIAPEVAKQLFQPFFTTSESGTGLGLYIAQELARANQATLSYLPDHLQGAGFRVRLMAPGTGWGQ